MLPIKHGLGLQTQPLCLYVCPEVTKVVWHHELDGELLSPGNSLE